MDDIKKNALNSLNDHEKEQAKKLMRHFYIKKHLYKQ
jgi:hypothetical protein